MNYHLMMAEVICNSGARRGFKVNPEWHMGRIEAARDIVLFGMDGKRQSQGTLDAITHANESLYLIRSGTA